MNGMVTEVGPKKRPTAFNLHFPARRSEAEVRDPKVRLGFLRSWNVALFGLKLPLLRAVLHDFISLFRDMFFIGTIDPSSRKMYQFRDRN
jgi:hypothetical protein